MGGSTGAGCLWLVAPARRSRTCHSPAPPPSETSPQVVRGGPHDTVVNAAGRRGTVAQDFIERFEDAYDREVQAWVDATRRGEVTGPIVRDGYAVAAVCEAGVRARTEGRRVEVELVGRPALYR